MQHCFLGLIPFLLQAVIAIPPFPAQNLAKRDGGMSDCNGGSYSGKYSDNQGSYVTSDTITHPYKFPLIRKCWQDYIVVDQLLWWVTFPFFFKLSATYLAFI